MKRMKRKMLGVLLSAALLASMMLPSGVTAAEVGEAVGVTPSTAATEATTTDTATEEVTVIDEVSETAETVDAAEVVEEDEEVTIIDEVSETAETVDMNIDETSSTRSDYRDKYSVSTTCTFTATGYTYVACNTSNSGTTNGTSWSYSSATASIDSTTYSGETVAKFTQESAGNNNLRVLAQETSTSLSGTGLYFEILSNVAISSDTTLTLYGTNGKTALANQGSANGNNPQIGNSVNITNYMTQLSESTAQYVYVVMVPWSAFGDDIELPSGKLLSMRIWCSLNTLSGTDNCVAFSHVGFYTEPTTLEDIRTDNNVVVVQDFEYSSASSDSEATTDVYNNGAGVFVPSIGSTYLDNAAEFSVTTADAQNLRFQTSATALTGEGLYFEMASSVACAISSNASIGLYDTTSAQAQALSTATQIGSTISAGKISGSYMTLVDEDTNTYAVMIPWSAFGIDDLSDVTISNGLSVRLWLGASIVTQYMVLDIDNIGFYTFGSTDNVLSSNTDDTVAVTTSTIYGYGSDTIYAKVSADDITTYDNSKYPTTVLTYGDNNYIFAGWYSDNGSNACESMPATASYAKFVDANVLLVGLQTSKVSDTTGTFDIRFVSTVDTNQYSNTGFMVTLSYSGVEKSETLQTEEVYETIYATDKDYDSGIIYQASDKFSTASSYFSTATITGISYSTASNYTIVSIYAYWKTLDGTTVIYSVPTASLTNVITFNGSQTLADLYDVCWPSTSGDE